jgi:hypothetical protein
MVILLNVLIALYNSAYEDITQNAIDEYMALFSQKTMQFVRAPDENVFIAPFNLIEMFCLILPFEWWMDEKRYDKLNDMVRTLASICCLPLRYLHDEYLCICYFRASAMRQLSPSTDYSTFSLHFLQAALNPQSS